MGTYENINEKGMQANKAKIADHYHYSQKGSDFTFDMYEKHNPIAPIKPIPTLRTHYIATKDLEMGQSRMSSKRTALAEQNTNRRLVTNEDPNNEDHPGIRSIKCLKPPPKFINHELKNPRDFEELIENMTERYIPAILIAPSTPCAKIVIFYHANAEDIGQAYSFCKDLNEKLEVELDSKVLLFTC